MTSRLEVVNCAEIAESGWTFLKKPLADMPLNWSFFSARPQSVLERLIRRPNLARLRSTFAAAQRAARSPDSIVISHLPKTTMWVGIFSRLLSVKSRHVAFAFNFTTLPAGLELRLMRWAFRSVDRFVVFSNAERLLYAEFFGIDKARIDFLPWVMGIPDSPGPAFIQGKYLCAVGSEGRDYDTFVEAVRRVPDVEAVIVTRAYNAARGPLPKNVTVHTELAGSTFWNVVKHAHFVALPLRDGQTNCGHITLVGALQLGRPIVASRSRGIEDYVQADVNALIVPPGDPQALASQIDRLWNDAGLHHDLASKIAEAQRLRPNESAWADYFRAYFERLLSPSDAPNPAT